MKGKSRHQINSINIDVESIERISNDDRNESSHQFNSQVNKFVKSVDFAIDIFFETNFKIDYTTLLKKEKLKTKKLKQKKKYKMIMIRNKLLSISIRDEKVISKNKQ